MHKPATLLALLLFCLHCGSSSGTGGGDDPPADNPPSDSNPPPSTGSETSPPPPSIGGQSESDASPQPKPTPGDGGTADAPTGAQPISLVGVANAHDNNQTIQALSVNQPAGATSGDLLVATIYLGNDALGSLPTFTSPAGWTLVDQTNRSSRGSLLVAWHAVGASEPPSYTWTSNAPVYGVGWIAAYRGVKVA